MDNAFLSYACDILADTSKGLTGIEIVKYCNKFALEYNVIIPVDNVEMLKMNYRPQIPNKRTALKRNLEVFQENQQIEIIRMLSESPKFKGNNEIKELIDKMNTRFNLKERNNLQEKTIETKHWLSKYPKSLKVYNEAIEKFNKNIYPRNLLDDMRLSLELLLKELLNNNLALEKQLDIVGKKLKNENVSKEIRNLFGKMLEYYGKYQNNNIKHNDNVNNKNEIELIINQTSIFMQFLIKTLG